MTIPAPPPPRPMRPGTSGPIGATLHAGGVVACLLLGGCNIPDCGDPRVANVALTVPTPSWSVDTFCLDNSCLTAKQRVPMPEHEEELPYSYVIEVPATETAHRYRVVLTSPDGLTHTYEGEVETARPPGDECRPNVHLASLTIDDNGELTEQRP